MATPSEAGLNRARQKDRLGKKDPIGKRPYRESQEELHSCSVNQPPCSQTSNLGFFII